MAGNKSGFYRDERRQAADIDPFKKTHGSRTSATPAGTDMATRKGHNNEGVVSVGKKPGPSKQRMQE